MSCIDLPQPTATTGSSTRPAPAPCASGMCAARRHAKYGTAPSRIPADLFSLNVTFTCVSRPHSERAVKYRSLERPEKRFHAHCGTASTRKYPTSSPSWGREGHCGAFTEEAGTKVGFVSSGLSATMKAICAEHIATSWRSFAR